MDIPALECENTHEIVPMPGRPNCTIPSEKIKNAKAKKTIVLKRNLTSQTASSLICRQYKIEKGCVWKPFGPNLHEFRKSLEDVTSCPTANVCRDDVVSFVRGNKNASDQDTLIYTAAGQATTYHCIPFYYNINTYYVWECKRYNLLTSTFGDNVLIMDEGVEFAKMKEKVKTFNNALYIWEDISNDIKCPYIQHLTDVCVWEEHEGKTLSYRVVCQTSQLILDVDRRLGISTVFMSCKFPLNSLFLATDGTQLLQLDDPGQMLPYLPLSKEDTHPLSLQQAQTLFALESLSHHTLEQLIMLSHQICLNSFSLWEIGVSLLSSDPIRSARSFFRRDDIIAHSFPGGFIVTPCQKTSVRLLSNDTVCDGLWKTTDGRYLSLEYGFLSTNRTSFNCKHVHAYFQIDAQYAVFLSSGSKGVTQKVITNFFSSGVSAWSSIKFHSTDLYTPQELNTDQAARSRLDHLELRLQGMEKNLGLRNADVSSFGETITLALSYLSGWFSHLINTFIFLTVIIVLLYCLIKCCCSVGYSARASAPPRGREMIRIPTH